MCLLIDDQSLNSRQKIKKIPTKYLSFAIFISIMKEVLEFCLNIFRPKNRFSY